MDLKRSDFLPSYDDEGVRLLLSEMNDLHDKFAEIVSSTTDADVDPYSPAVKAALSYYHECLCRNRRYINRSVVHDIVLMMKAVNLIFPRNWPVIFTAQHLTTIQHGDEATLRTELPKFEVYHGKLAQFYLRE